MDNKFTLISIPEPTHKLMIRTYYPNQTCMVLHTQGRPNAWIRFWHWALLGWTWEKL
jgi:hypothetical protein